MGFDLLLAMWIAYYLTRNTVQDLAWKARGEDPPSFRREQQRLREKKAKRPVTDRREARRFFANAWNDAWESAGERRARGYAQRASQRREAWEHQDQVEDAERQAHDRNQEMDRAEEEAYNRNADLGRCETCDGQCADADLQPRHIGDERRFALVCPACAQAIDRRAAADGGDDRQRPDDAPGHAAAWEAREAREASREASKDGADVADDRTGEEDAYEVVPPDHGSGPPDQSSDQPASPSAEPGTTPPGRDAQVIHLNAWQPATPIQEPTQQQEEHVSETTSLNSALAYTTQMAGNAAQAVTSIETSIASLQAGGVTGPTITALQAAMEAMNTAAAQFHSAHAALQRHIQVQEAYNANADAGTRQFVTSD